MIRSEIVTVIDRTFQPLDAQRTQMTEVLEMRLSGLPRLLEPVIRRQLPGQGQQVHHRLKKVLEQG